MTCSSAALGRAIALFTAVLQAITIPGSLFMMTIGHLQNLRQIIAAHQECSAG